MEKYGATVTWDNVNKIAIVNYNGITVEVPIGQNYIIKNGEKILNDTVSVIKDNRIYLPIRIVLESFNMYVYWDYANMQVVAVSPHESYFTKYPDILSIKSIVPNIVLKYEFETDLSEFGILYYYNYIFSASSLEEAEKYAKQYSDYLSNKGYKLVSAVDDPVVLQGMGSDMKYTHHTLNPNYDIEIKSEYSWNSSEQVINYSIYVGIVHVNGTSIVLETKEKEVDDSIDLYGPNETTESKDEFSEIKLWANNLDGFPTPNISGAYELKNFLEDNYSKIYTPTGVYRPTFEINKNDSKFYGYDYVIEIGNVYFNAYDLLEGGINNYTEEEKEITKQILTQFSKEVASCAITALPQYKIMGKFTDSWYEYPYLKVGYDSVEAMVWSNYIDDDGIGSWYEYTEITEFGFDPATIEGYDKVNMLSKYEPEYTIAEYNYKYNSYLKNDETNPTSEYFNLDDYDRTANGYDWSTLSNENKKLLVEKIKNEIYTSNDINSTYKFEDIFNYNLNWYVEKIDELYDENSNNSLLSIYYAITECILDESILLLGY
jgi:hypothetical protein